MPRRLEVLILVLLMVVAFSSDFSKIVEASRSLGSVSFHVTAERFMKRTSKVEFDFCFKRPNMMRIEYTYPKNMKGSVVAIDGKYVYNYILSLNRKMKKRISGNSANPGKDMGVLFDHVAGYDEKTIEGWKITFEGGEVISIEGKECETYKFRIIRKDDEETVWFEKKTLFPIKIEIHRSGKLVLRITVEKLVVNPKLDEKIFKPF